MIYARRVAGLTPDARKRLDEILDRDTPLTPAADLPKGAPPDYDEKAIYEMTMAAGLRMAKGGNG